MTRDPEQPVLGIKIDVDTYDGLREGVPRLLRLLARHGVRATFYVPGGPDHSGRAVLRVLRQRGFLQKMLRTGGLRLYGPVTALRGTLLPGVPMTQAAAELRAIVDEGHDIGVHGWDHVAWHDAVDRRSYPEVVATLSRARDALEQASGARPPTAGAPGWHATFATLHAVDTLGFAFASDFRGHAPFLPRVHAYTFRTPQLPTTLPTLDEVVRPGDRARELVRRYLRWVNAARPWNVLTCHAELEGRAYASFLDELLAALAAEGVAAGALGELAAALPAPIPPDDVERGRVPGRAGDVSVQARTPRVLPTS